MANFVVIKKVTVNSKLFSEETLDPIFVSKEDAEEYVQHLKSQARDLARSRVNPKPKMVMSRTSYKVVEDCYE